MVIVGRPKVGKARRQLKAGANWNACFTLYDSESILLLWKKRRSRMRTIYRRLQGSTSIGVSFVNTTSWILITSNGSNSTIYVHLLTPRLPQFIFVALGLLREAVQALQLLKRWRFMV
uniref:Uncharacterized protein n=1 Tax=Hyaloperonospora arabidopsidis (strain Emoy2) TaxID=559515 RepID=M4C3X4_HYAAE